MHTLIIFARQPIAGRTKTRLCPPLDGATAAALYACFLHDVLALARALPGVRPLIAYTPDRAGRFFAELAPDIESCPQRGAGLGERMDLAFHDSLGPTTDPSPPLRAGDRRPTTDLLDKVTRRQGDKVTESSDSTHPLTRSPVHLFTQGVVGGQWSVVGGRWSVIIGSDSPDLPAAYVREAFARLDAGADVVLGPAEDGGYYLIGLRAPRPGLLRGVPMSTPTVLADTLARADALGLRAALLPPWPDVDTIADLRRLAARLRDAPPDAAPRTRAFLIGMADTMRDNE